MLAAILPTPVDIHIPATPWSASSAPDLLRAGSETADKRGFGDFLLASTAETAQYDPPTGRRGESAATMESSRLPSDSRRSPDAQQPNDDAQGLPTSEVDESAGSVESAPDQSQSDPKGGNENTATDIPGASVSVEANGEGVGNLSTAREPAEAEPRSNSAAVRERSAQQDAVAAPSSAPASQSQAGETSTEHPDDSDDPDDSGRRQTTSTKSDASREPARTAQLLDARVERSRLADPLQTSDTIGRSITRIHGSGDAEQARPADRPAQAPKSEGASQQRIVTEQSAAQPPAAARAEQVENTIRLENATGQQPITEAARPQTGSIAAPASLDARVPIAPAQDGQNLSLHLAQQVTGGSADSARLEEAPMTSRIVRGLSAMLNQRGGALSMRLDPPELGSLRIQMTISRGVVTAQLTAQTAQAHGLLENNLASLRAGLESHGLTVDRLSVHLSSSASQNGAQHHQQDAADRGAQNGQNHADAGGSESRGRRDGERSRDESPHAAAPNGFGEFIERLSDNGRRLAQGVMKR